MGAFECPGGSAGRFREGELVKLVEFALEEPLVREGGLVFSDEGWGK